MAQRGAAIIGTSTDPRRFSDDDLMERELSYGRAGFNLQFMLDTTLSDADRYPLKLRDLIVIDADIKHSAPEKLIWGGGAERAIHDLPCVGLNGDRYHSPAQVSQEWIPYTGSVLAIDPSGRGKDETAYAVLKMLNGYIFLTEVGGLQGGYGKETLAHLAGVAKDHKVNAVIIEANFGDGMFTELLRPVLAKVHPCLIEEVKHNKQKELRIIDTLEPVISGHRLVVAAHVIRSDFTSTKGYPTEHAHKYQLFWQMSHITRDRGSLAHEDRLDVVAIGVNYWIQHMAQDVDRNVQIRQEQVLLQELDTFRGHALSHQGKRLDKTALEGLRDTDGFDQTIIQLGMQQSHVVGLGAVDLSLRASARGRRWI